MSSSSNSTNMDPEVWGDLQHHSSLESVYLKLPLREFFQLRGVCKDWNRLARQRRCPTDPIHKPYFVLPYMGLWYGMSYHTDILTFHIVSGHWKLNSLPWDTILPPRLWCAPFSVKGLVCSVSERFAHRIFVYDSHTKRRCYIPEVPNMSGRPQALGMAVDTSVTPFTFKLILGSLNSKTQIYDSTTNSWETKTSLLIPCVSTQICMSCLHCDDLVYIWLHFGTILVYSLKEDMWNTLDPPPRHEKYRVRIAMGYWDGRVFAVTNDDGSSPLVWELIDLSRQTWRHFASIPPKMHAWLTHKHQSGNLMQVITDSCDEFLLIYSRNLHERKSSGKLVLFNLATKQWEKAEIYAP